MRTTLSILILAIVCSTLSPGLIQDQRVDRRKLRKTHKDINTYVTLKASRDSLVVPVSWKEVFFRHDLLPEKGDFEASAVFSFARTYFLDTVYSLTDSAVFRFGHPGFPEFFRTFKPLSLERTFNSTPFDTVRVDAEGRRSRRVDLSVFYRMYFADSSLQSAIEALSRILGVDGVRRPERGVEF